MAWRWCEAIGVNLEALHRAKARASVTYEPAVTEQERLDTATDKAHHTSETDVSNRDLDPIVRTLSLLHEFNRTLVAAAEK